MNPIMFTIDPRTESHEVCFCAAYQWPHADSIGKCHAKECASICSICHMPIEDYIYLDEGVGAYEFWGAIGYDVQWVEATACCKANERPNDINALIYRRNKWLSYSV